MGDQPSGEHRALSGRELRALAHPLRLRLLELLREGPSTASLLARRLNESTGATSYHLRELHRYGFIDEDAERGRGRERWWRRRERVLLVAPTPDDDADADAGYARLRSIFVDRDATALDRFLQLDLTPRWQKAAMIGNWSVVATPEEVERLTESLVALVDPLRRAAEDAPPGATAVHVSFRALPQSDEVAPPRTERR